MSKALNKTKSDKKTKQIKVTSNEEQNELVKVLVTKDFLLRNMEFVLTGQTIELDKEYAEILQKKLGFKILN